MDNLPEHLRTSGGARLRESVETAAQARRLASPRLSKYAVGAAVAVKGNGIFAGANVEYGAGYGIADSRGIHAEEVAVASAIMACGRDIEIEAVAVTAAGTPLCCGNCLDVIRSYATRDTLVIAAGETETKIVRLTDLLPERFPKAEGTDAIGRLLNEAIRVSRFSNHKYSSSIEKASGAAVLGGSGAVHVGVREDSAAFHPVSAIENALGASRAGDDRIVEIVVFASGSGQLSGRDRQKLIERGLEIGNVAFPVYMHSLDTGETWAARCSELLPHAFTGDGI